jgi:2-polyprenyl-3-methyl-5-hydroxy-6-metoxy-1,4-benzoquinol methylase
MKNTLQNNQILDQQSKYYGTYLKIKNNPRYRKVWNYIEGTIKKKAKILDIGCTDGEFSAPLIKKGFNCFGLEFMEEAIKESRKKGIIVKKGSFLEIFPFRDNTFDLVFAGEVVEHTINDDDFLSEIHRVLKKGGVCVITTPNLVSLGNRMLMMFGKLPRFSYSEFHYRIYNQELIVSKLKNAGLKTFKIESNYVLISTFFNKFLGKIGESLGTIFPSLGENLIIYGKKK